MSLLFSANKIHVATYGRPSRPYSKLAVVEAVTFTTGPHT
jgi:hypothetical protein